MTTYPHLFDLTKKVAIVTGGAGVLGSEFCHALCAMGASVACLDTDKSALLALEKKLQVLYGEDKILTVPCNVANPADIASAIALILKKFSKIDILVNNAATKTADLDNFFAPFETYHLETWREVMSVNLDGMFLMAQAVGKHMVQNKNGAIIQIASIYSLMGSDNRIYEDSFYLGRQINNPAVYTASKAGVIGLTKQLATDWAEIGIRVNALCPGGVKSGQNTTFENKYAHRIPMRRMAEKIDIVGPLLFLASDAARYLTGQVIFADGGLSAW